MWYDYQIKIYEINCKDTKKKSHRQKNVQILVYFIIFFIALLHMSKKNIIFALYLCFFKNYFN